jgi:hypothetical protein
MYRDQSFLNRLRRQARFEEDLIPLGEKGDDLKQDHKSCLTICVHLHRHPGEWPVFYRKPDSCSKHRLAQLFLMQRFKKTGMSDERKKSSALYEQFFKSL